MVWLGPRPMDLTTGTVEGAKGAVLGTLMVGFILAVL